MRTKGVQSQTRRHVADREVAWAIRAFVGVVNKMDAVGFDAGSVSRPWRQGLRELLGADSPIIPACALDGDGVTRAGARMPWYAGPTLLDVLEAAIGSGANRRSGFRMPVQWVNRA